jgi:hypothetical protein
MQKVVVHHQMMLMLVNKTNTIKYRSSGIAWKYTLGHVIRSEIVNLISGGYSKLFSPIREVN